MKVFGNKSRGNYQTLDMDYNMIFLVIGAR
jgi:hypothetical protein